MDMRISPGALHGRLRVPASKYAAHRAVICAALADGVSTIGNIDINDDISATIAAATSLGAVVHREDRTLRVTGVTSPPERCEINCGESGSTLRFFVPVAAALGVNAGFYGAGKLPERPITPLTDALCAHGITVAKNKNEILMVSGRLQAGTFELPGNVSSQYITGLLFALPILDGDSTIILTSHLESSGYVDMTIEALERAGIKITTLNDGYSIEGNQKYKAVDSIVEGDFSSAAFWLCAGAVNSDITLDGLPPYSSQGDGEIIPILKQFGANIGIDGAVHASPGALAALEIDARDIPDLVPILAVVAAYAGGTTVIYNAGRLRIKESDRLSAVSTGLNILGADIEECPDKLIITGKKQLSGGAVSSFNDHRIAMAMSIAALGCRNEVIIRDAECVSKSYPGFFSDFKSLGGICDVVGMG